MGLRREIKVKTITIVIKKHHFATIEINKEIYVIHVTFGRKQKLEHEIGIVQNRVDLNGLSKLA